MPVVPEVPEVPVVPEVPDVPEEPEDPEGPTSFLVVVEVVGCCRFTSIFLLLELTSMLISSGIFLSYKWVTSGKTFNLNSKRV